MKAQVIKEFGKPDIFQEVNVEKPCLLPGHVLVKVEASSVNPLDCKIRSGVTPEIAPTFPAILHGDLAGVIESVANDVTQFEAGDEVFGWIGGIKGRPGALSEFALVDAKLIAKKPRSLSTFQSAALPLVSITAWEALFDKTDVKAGDHVLIHGGVGGVGHIAVQLAKWRGATVSTTVLKDEDIQTALALNADYIINAKQEPVSDYVERLTKSKGFDIVLDTVGGANIDNSFIAAKLNGHVVTTAARSTHDLSIMHNKGLSLHVVFTLLPLLYNEEPQKYGAILTQIARLVDEHMLRPLIDPNHFTFNTVNLAHEFLERGKTKGKVVLAYS